jgi:hypothetical protein
MLLSPFAGLPQAFAGRGLGWHPSPPKAAHEAPDHLLADGHISLATTAPPAADASRLVLSILDQGPIGSCTANATAQAVRASQAALMLGSGLSLETVLHVPPPLLSRLMLYWLARSRWGEKDVDSGTYIRTIFEMLVDFGFAPESKWPYVVDDLGSSMPKWRTTPASIAFIDAEDQKAPTKYARIDSDGDQRIEDIKRAVASDFLVVFGCPVTQNFCQGRFDPTLPIPVPSSTDLIAGGHAMTIARYDSAGVGVPNSWGYDFGVNGWVKFSWEYVTSQMDDIWIVQASPMYPADLMGGEAA